MRTPLRTGLENATSINSPNKSKCTYIQLEPLAQRILLER